MQGLPGTVFQQDNARPHLAKTVKSYLDSQQRQFQTTQTVVRRPVGGSPRVTNPAEDRYIAIVAKRNRRATSTRVTSVVTVSIGKALSAATVRRSLHMNELYPGDLEFMFLYPSNQEGHHD
ncbi:HTH_Tnp_Tc3_2 domain-containing protein [Trichonephila clavipes]|nr:HTH_Tnp_Tc3_2 domain-containing protein [Trichonephila clavipes]